MISEERWSVTEGSTDAESPLTGNKLRAENSRIVPREMSNSEEDRDRSAELTKLRCRTSLALTSPWRIVIKDQGRHLEKNQAVDRVSDEKSKAMGLVLQKVCGIATGQQGHAKNPIKLREQESLKKTDIKAIAGFVKFAIYLQNERKLQLHGNNFPKSYLKSSLHFLNYPPMVISWLCGQLKSLKKKSAEYKMCLRGPSGCRT